MTTLTFIAALVLSFPGAVILLQAIRNRRLPEDHCVFCEFDLSGIRGLAQRCPECGNAILDRQHRLAVYRHERAANTAIGLTLLAPLCVLLILAHQFAADHGLYAVIAPNLTFARDVRSGTFTPHAYETEAVQIIRDYAAGNARESLMCLAVEYVLGCPAKEAKAPGNEGFVAETASGVALADMLLDWNADVERFDALVDAVLKIGAKQGGVFETNVAQALGRLADSPLSAPDEKRVIQQGIPLLAPIPESMRFNMQNYTRRFVARNGPRLTASQYQRLIQLFLSSQASTTSTRWHSHWGMAIEHAASSGFISNAQFARYLDGAFRPRIELPYGTPLRAGDLVRIRVNPRWRIGTPLPFLIRISGATPADQAHVHACGRTEHVFQSHESSSWDPECWLIVPDDPGPCELTLDVEAIFDQDVITHMDAPTSDLSGFMPVWSKLPRVHLKKKVRTTFDIVPSDAPPLTHLDLGIAPSDIHIARTSLRGTTDKHGSRLELTINVATPPSALAFDAVAVQGDTRVPLGWDLCPRYGFTTLEYAAQTDGLDLDHPFVVELTSNPGPLIRPREFSNVWNGSLRVYVTRTYAGYFCDDYLRPRDD